MDISKTFNGCLDVKLMSLSIGRIGEGTLHHFSETNVSICLNEKGRVRNDGVGV